MFSEAPYDHEARPGYYHPNLAQDKIEFIKVHFENEEDVNDDIVRSCVYSKW